MRHFQSEMSFFLPAADSISAVEKPKRLRELWKRVKEQPLSDFAATASAAADNQLKTHDLTRVCGYLMFDVSIQQHQK